MSETPKTVFVTKYALEAGTIEEANPMGPENDDGVYLYGWLGLMPKGDYAHTMPEACRQASMKREAKIASLRKQIAKLEAMTFA